MATTSSLSASVKPFSSATRTLRRTLAWSQRIRSRWRSFSSGARSVRNVYVRTACETYTDFVHLPLVKGPYDLQGRTNVASGAWREYEKSKLEKMSHAVEDEDKGKFLINSDKRMLIIDDDQIDPRLINAQPGQFVLPQVPEMLSYADDHYYRRQNQSWDEHRRHVSRTPSWQHQLQHAATTTPHPSVQVPGRGWSYGQSPIGKPQAPSYVQDLGQRHGAFAVQAPTGAAGASYNATLGPPLSRVASFQSPYHPSVPQARAYPADGSYVGGQLQHHTSLAYREVPTQQQLMQMPPSDHGINYGPVITTPSRSPAANAASSTPAYASGSAAIPTADIAHLRGNEWAEMAQQRARAFSMLSQHEKAQRLLQMQQPQAAQGPFQPNPLQPQLQQGLMQLQNADPTQHFSNHPGFSNVRSAFPNTQFIAGMDPHQAPAQKDDVEMKGLPFGTDLRWR
jgi:hypothetical protein